MDFSIETFRRSFLGLLLTGIFAVLACTAWLLWPVWEELADIGPNARDAELLIAKLHDSRPEIRREAARALGSIGLSDEATVTAIQEASETDDEAKVQAQLALWKIGAGSGEIVASLRELLKDTRNRREAIQALASIGPGAKAATADLLEIMSSSDHGFHCDAAEAVWKIDGRLDRVIPFLVNALEDEQCSGCAANVFHDMGPTANAAIPALVGLLTDSEAEQNVRWTAAFSLAAIGPDALPALVQTIRDGDKLSRECIADALACMSPECKAALPRSLRLQMHRIRRAHLSSE